MNATIALRGVLARAALVIGLAAAGCSQSIGHLSTLSTTPQPEPVHTGGPRVTGRSCTAWVLGYPVGTPSLEEATRAAQRKNGAPLEDVIVRKTYWSAVVYGQECLVVDAALARKS